MIKFSKTGKLWSVTTSQLTAKTIVKSEEKMIEDYRLTQKSKHPIFNSASAVAVFYKISRKHL